MAAGSRDADLSYALGAHRVDVGIVLVDPGHVHLADVGVGGDVVLGEVVVYDVPEAGIDQALLVQRHGQPHRHPADELRAGRLGVDDVPDGEHPGHARDAHLARVLVDPRLGEVRPEGVHRVVLGPGCPACRPRRCRRRPDLWPCRSRNARAAPKIVEPQAVIPDEPPATEAEGSSVSPMRRSIVSTPTSRASAAIWVSAVHVPVPMSAAPISTTYRPSSSKVILAFEPGILKTGYMRRGDPRSHEPPSFTTGARGRVAALPAEALGPFPQAGDEVAAGVREPCLRVERRVRCGCGTRWGRGRTLMAISSIADSSAYIPGASPGARIQDGTGTSSAARRWVVRRVSVAYIVLVA